MSFGLKSLLLPWAVEVLTSHVRSRVRSKLPHLELLLNHYVMPFRRSFCVKNLTGTS